MIFLLNIGNTNTQSAYWDNGCLSDLKVLRTADFKTETIPSDIPVAIASVVPELSEKINGKNIFFLRAGIKTGMDTSGMDMEKLGGDRLANAIALCHYERLPAICIDFGTAVTFEVVDAARRFQGGAILPGRALQRKALNDYTAKLPYVEIDSNSFRKFPAGNTSDAIKFGIDTGLVGAVKELIEKIKSHIGITECSLIGAGGDAFFFKQDIPGMEICGSEYTLKGIAKAWELNFL